jgi:hypothetical protein
VWKPQADKLGLLLQYRLNPAAAAAFAEAGSPVTLSNVVFIMTYEGARASGVQTKPTGTHLKDKHVVYWRLGDVTLTDAWEKIICRVIGEQNAEPKPGHVEVRWEYPSGRGGSGISVSRLVEDKGKGKEPAAAATEEEDPFADVEAPSPPPDGPVKNWVDVPLVRRLVSGKYEAK